MSSMVWEMNLILKKFLQEFTHRTPTAPPVCATNSSEQMSLCSGGWGKEPPRISGVADANLWVVKKLSWDEVKDPGMR